MEKEISILETYLSEIYEETWLKAMDDAGKAYAEAVRTISGSHEFEYHFIVENIKKFADRPEVYKSFQRAETAKLFSKIESAYLMGEAIKNIQQGSQGA
jgi:hypothetical protein